MLYVYHVLFLLFLLVQGATTGAEFSLDDLPDGYPQGRLDAAYGAYSTPFYSKRARTYADLLDKVEVKIYGLRDYSPNDVKQAEAAYYLENILVGTLLKLVQEDADALSRFDQLSLFYRAEALYHSQRYEAQRLYEIMLRKIDVAYPGPNGAQLREENPVTGEVYYCSNCRSEIPPSVQQQKEFYMKKLKEFMARGKSPRELHQLTKKYVDSLGAITRLEYTESDTGLIRVTEGDAGHALLAKGKRVKSAGQILLLKNPAGKVVFAVVSNASGTYKPDLYSAKLLSDRLRTELTSAGCATVITEGEPLGTQTLKVLMKANGMSKNDIELRIREAEIEARRLLQVKELETPTRDNSAQQGQCAAALTAVSLPAP